MVQYSYKILQEIEEEIGVFSSGMNDSLLSWEKIIDTVLTKISDLKKNVLDKGFANQEDEIFFFKELKPKIVAKLIYYNTVYRIETRKPHGSKREVKKYLNTELSKLKHFFENNLEFYRYYRTNSTYLDHKYFVRGKYDIKLILDTYYFESDHSFSTSHDYKVAKIIANDLIQVYIEDQLLKLSKSEHDRDEATDLSKLPWRLSKASLVELIYALHSVSAFEGGKLDIKEIAIFFEETFEVDLGDIYHVFLEIRNRKINRTKFLDLLREELLKKMDEYD
ncbi:RteC domain-containing protein [Empedobacter brevis]